MSDRTRQSLTKQILGIAVGVALVLFILACTFFVWQASMVLYRVEQAMGSMSGDIKKMTSLAGNIAEDVEDIRRRMKVLEEKTDDAVGWEDITTMLDETKKVRESATRPASPLPEKAEDEIDYLLRQITLSDRRFSLIGRPVSGRMAGAYLLSKYKIYSNTINSTEQFIDDIATKTITGHTYYVYAKDSDEQKTPLADFLKDILKKHRAKPTGETETPTTED